MGGPEVPSTGLRINARAPSHGWFEASHPGGHAAATACTASALGEAAPTDLQRHWLATRHECHRCLACGRPVSAAVGICGATMLHGLMAFFSKLLAFQDQLWLQLLHRSRWFFVLRFAFNVALPTLPPAQPPPTAPNCSPTEPYACRRSMAQLHWCMGRGLVTCRGRASRPIQAPWAQLPPRDRSTTSSCARAGARCPRTHVPCRPAPGPSLRLRCSNPDACSCACADVDRVAVDCMWCGGDALFLLVTRRPTRIFQGRTCVCKL